MNNLISISFHFSFMTAHGLININIFIFQLTQA